MRYTTRPLSDRSWRAWMVCVRAAYPDAPEGWWEHAVASLQQQRPFPGLACPHQLFRLAQRHSHPDTRPDGALETFEVVQRAIAVLRSERR